MKRIIEFLLKRRWFTNNEQRAEKSIFEWGTDKDMYFLSLLGVINGLIYNFGMVIVVIDKEKIKIKKPWF